MIRTFTGKNSYRLHTELQKAVAAALEQAGEFGVERFDAADSDVDTLLQAVQSLPFLSPQKLVIISNIQSNLALMERLEELVDRTADGVDVILVEPHLDKRKSGYKLLQKLTRLQEFLEPKPQDLPKWLTDYATQFDATLSKADANYLVERVGANQQLLASEVEKLALYNSTITRNSIDLLTSESIQSTIFSLLDAAFARNPKRALELYREQRNARIDPHYIVAMLTWQLQAIALAVYSETKSESELVSAGQSPYSARKALTIARNLNRIKTKQMIVDLSELDAAIKSTSDPDSALELYLLSL